MKIHSISVFNINSLKGEFTIDFSTQPLQDCGLFAITGPTGAGKTTLLDALTLALYGDVARRAEVESIMTYGCGECRAEVVFQNAKGTFKARWSMRRAHGKADGAFQPPKRELADWPSGENIITKKAEVEAGIKDITGLSKEQFLKSVLLAQGDFTAFLKAKDSERAALLEKMTSTQQYRELSQKAYRKMKQEEEATQRLKDRLGDIRIMPAEEEEQKNKERTAAQSEANIIRRDKKVFEQDKTWVISLQRLTEENEDAQERHQRAAANKLANEDAYRSWTAHTRIVPFETRILDWRKAGQDLENLKLAIEGLEKNRDQLKQQKESNETAYSEARLQHQSAHDLLSAQRPVLQQAITAEDLIRSQESQLKTLRGQIAQKQTQHGKASDQLKRAKAAQESDVRELEALSQSLETQAGDGQLPPLLSECQGKFATLAHLRDQAKRHDGEIRAQGQIIENASQQKQQADQQHQSAAQDLDRLQSRKVSISTALAQWHSYALQQESMEHQHLVEVEAEMEDTLRELLAKEVFIRHHQALKDGQPCPLCGSAEHPNAGQNAWEAEEQVAMLKAHKRAQDQRKTALLESQRNTATLVAQLAGMPVAEEFPAECNDTAWRSVEVLLQEYRNLPVQVERFEHQHRQACINADVALTATESARQKMTAEQAELDQVLQEGKNAAAFFENIARTYAEVYRAGGESNLIVALEARSKRFMDNHQRRDVVQVRLSEKEKAIAGERANLEQIQAELDDWTASATTSERDITEQRQQNRERFPASYATPTLYLAHLEKMEAETLRTQNDAQQAFSKTASGLDFEQKQLDSKIQEFSANEAAIRQATDQLQTELTSAGLAADIEQAATGLLGVPVRDRLKATLDALDREESLSAQAAVGCRDKLDAHTALSHCNTPLEDIIAALSELEQRLTAVEQNIGALVQGLRENEARKKQQEGLLQDVLAQQATALRWRELSSLIGSASGDAFARFAQTISLEQLLCFANEHLRGLSDRYQLRCNADDPEDLRLMVEDAHLAGCTRDTKTLSGGESFLISLGLALGLAEMASQSTRIDSLFIDEGFGTLDEGTLDDAITTLESLQARGKTIGVISHVEQLKERIQTQVVVTKRGNGFSNITVSPTVD